MCGKNWLTIPYDSYMYLSDHGPMLCNQWCAASSVHSMVSEQVTTGQYHAHHPVLLLLLILLLLLLLLLLSWPLSPLAPSYL